MFFILIFQFSSAKAASQETMPESFSVRIKNAVPGKAELVERKGLRAIAHLGQNCAEWLKWSHRHMPK
jgi:hypothetical protein